MRSGKELPHASDRKIPTILIARDSLVDFYVISRTSLKRHGMSKKDLEGILKPVDSMPSTALMSLGELESITFTCMMNHRTSEWAGNCTIKC